MGAAFVAPGEALVDAIAVGLVGDDEDAAVGRTRRRRREGTRRSRSAERDRMAAPSDKGNRCASEYVPKR